MEDIRIGMNNKISIIVPVYNVAQYLHACIDSIINQTYKNIEVVLVDDGSTDDSGNICEEYKKNDERIIVVHQKNSGLSAARNVGIEISTGEYITFIDSDDYISPDYIENLYSALEQYSADIAICDLKKVSEKVELWDIDYKVEKNFKSILLNNSQTIEEVYKPEYHGIDFVAWAKLYKKDLFTFNKIEFPVGRIHEDTFTTYKLLYMAKKIAYIDIPMYFYRSRIGSITTSNFTLKELDKIVATKEECDFFVKERQYRLLQFALYDHLHEIKLIISSINKFDHQYDEQKRLLSAQLKEDLKYYSQFTKISLKKKIYYRLLAEFPIRLLANI